MLRLAARSGSRDSARPCYDAAPASEFIIRARLDAAGKSGIWSNGNISTIALEKVDTDATGIRINGGHVHNKGKVRVWFNRDTMGIYELDNVIIDVKEFLAKDCLFNITFVHTIP